MVRTGRGRPRASGDIDRTVRKWLKISDSNNRQTLITHIQKITGGVVS